MVRQMHSWYEDVVVARVAIVRLLPVAGAGLAGGLVLVNLALGLAPVAFILAASAVIADVPAAVRGGLESPAWNQLLAMFLLATLPFGVQQVMAPVQLALGVRMKRRVDGQIRARLLASTLGTTSMAALENETTRNALNEFTRQLDQDFCTPGEACAGMLALIARYARLAGLAAVVWLTVAWWAALGVVVVTMVFRYGQRGGLRRFATAWGDVAGDRSRADYFREVAMGSVAAKEIRVFGLLGWLADRYAAAMAAAQSYTNRRRRQIYLRPYVAYTAFALVVASAILINVARHDAADDVSVRNLAIALQAVMAGLLLGENYAEADLQTQFGMLSIAELKVVENAVQAESRPNPSMDLAAPTAAAVRFEGVTFGYPDSDHVVLDNLDLVLPAGTCTALVGLNGAGKTTLVRLLTRLYEPSSGIIRYGDTNIRDAEVSTWRRQLSVIFQDFVRYELSASDNIAFGAPHVPHDEAAIRRAADRAGILEVLDALPHGLDTVLSRAYDGGTDLSGGQWQRVAIARSLYALAAGARVLVLDEPTAALDVRAEAAFFEQYVDLTRGVTSLLISHRFSSVRHADQIVVLDGGRIIEQGPHDVLMKSNGRYAELFRLQAERFATDPAGEVSS